MTPVELGEGARRALSVDGRGRVVAVYRQAAYLRLPAGLVALVAGDVWRGPLHLRSPLDPSLLAPGDPVVVVAGSELGVGSWRVDLSDARLWRGALPDPAALRRAALDLSAGPPSALLQPMFARRLAIAVDRLAGADLAGTARALGGLGPGLTPAGDDALAGILLVTRALRGPAAEAGLVAVAQAVPTTSVARAQLEWAARGQGVEPVHDLLAALAGSDEPAVRVHLGALRGLGHTSGADLAYGLALGLRPRVIRVSPS